MCILNPSTLLKDYEKFQCSTFNFFSPPFLTVSFKQAFNLAKQSLYIFILYCCCGVGLFFSFWLVVVVTVVLLFHCF